MNKALEKEQRVGLDLQSIMLGGTIHLSAMDAKHLQSLLADASKAFRALRYKDYIKAVDAEEALVNRYKSASAQ